jgi:predicted nuclease of predicted toxin-antitoxin system
MKIVIDMNLSPRWATALCNCDFEATHWSTIGEEHASDASIAQWARDHDAIVLTRDLDFSKMLAIGGQARPSVVQLRLDQAPPERWASVIAALLAEHRQALSAGAVITVDESIARVRALPF